MHLIHKLLCQAQDEVDGAKEYAQCAIEYKVSKPQLGQMYYEMANAECGHATMLHDKILHVLDDKRKEGKLVEEVTTFCNERRECIVKGLAEAKVMLETYHR